MALYFEDEMIAGSSDPGTGVPPAAGGVTMEQVNAAISDAIASIQQGPTIDEYDTSDGWHVRKWSDGYVEMSVYQTATLATNKWGKWGDLYDGGAYTNQFPSMTLPVALVKSFSESTTLVEYGPVGTLGSCWLYLKDSTNTNGIITTKTHSYELVTASARTSTSYTISRNITGRWK